MTEPGACGRQEKIKGRTERPFLIGGEQV